MSQLKMARLNNASSGDRIDDELSNLEQALSDIFGITMDTDQTRITTISPDGSIIVLQPIKVTGATGLADGSHRFPYKNSMAKILRTQNLAFADTEFNSVPFDTVVFDTDSLYSAGASSGLRTKVSGKYLAIAHVSWANNPSGWRNVRLRINSLDTDFEIISPAVVSADTNIELTQMLDLAANDFVELIARQVSGGSLNLQTGTSLMLTYLGE
jgi:hypothetical protein